MEREINERVEICGRCICKKIVENFRVNFVNIKSIKFLEILCIDFLILEKLNGGFENVLVIIDYFIKYVMVVLIEN